MIITCAVGLVRLEPSSRIIILHHILHLINYDHATHDDHDHETPSLNMITIMSTTLSLTTMYVIIAMIIYIMIIPYLVWGNFNSNVLIIYFLGVVADSLVIVLGQKLHLV